MNSNLQPQQLLHTKIKILIHIVCTSPNVSFCENGYLDNGYSRHMTCERKYLKDIKPYLNNYVTYGFDLLHMDFMGHMQVKSLRGKKYVFFYVDDYSKYTRVDFIHKKFDTFIIFEAPCIRVQHEKGQEIRKIIRIGSDHDREFENTNFQTFCNI